MPPPQNVVVLTLCIIVLFVLYLIHCPILNDLVFWTLIGLKHSIRGAFSHFSQCYQDCVRNQIHCHSDQDKTVTEIE